MTDQDKTILARPEPPRVTLIATRGSLAGRRYVYLERDTAILGRGLDCNFRLPDDPAHRNVSRHHCRLDINPPRVKIRDLGSLNGTWINGRKIGGRDPAEPVRVKADPAFPEYDLRPGDEFQLGDTAFLVQVEGLVTSAEDDEPVTQPPSRDREKTLASALQTRPARVETCAGCGKRLAGQENRSRSTDLLCAACQSDPIATLKALLRAALKGQPELKALRGLKMLKLLGQGTQGAAFLARETNSGRRLALKVLLPEVAANKWAKESFLREMENTKVLDHPHVVRLFDSGGYRGLFFYTMEFCGGGSLDRLRKERGGKVPLTEAAPLILQALDGLDYIHNVEILKVKLADGGYGRGRGLVHRDLKPANLFLSGSGPARMVKIADVGVGKAFDTAGLSGQTRTGTVAGSPVFMPRQQVINFKYAKPDVDVWAMAATFYVTLTGQYPRDFPSDRDPWLTVLETPAVPIHRRDPNLPARLAEVIDAALVDRPEIIFKTAAEFKTALGAVL
ncbi:MAG: FHA domain-containing serine/threonine-protein kinase [Thermodesulfobacteriota bacterium]